jgi:hypothetical protein
MVRQAPFEDAELPRRGRAQPLAVGQSRPSRTTTSPHELVGRSCGRRRPSPRRQITPGVGLIGRMRVVGGIAGIHLGGPVAHKERLKSLVDEGRVGHSRTNTSCGSKEMCIHRGAQACAIHATSMPRSWHGAAGSAHQVGCVAVPEVALQTASTTVFVSSSVTPMLVISARPRLYSPGAESAEYVALTGFTDRLARRDPYFSRGVARLTRHGAILRPALPGARR